MTVAVSPPRIIVAGATTAITRRTTLRKAFLGPWHPLVTDIWLYSLAWAQQRTGVAIHHGQLVLNHEHLSVTPAAGNLPEFTHRLHNDVSRALNTLLAQERYDAPREIFDARQTHYMRLVDPESQARHLLYEHLNCVAAGLVDRPDRMPEHVFDWKLWQRGPIEVERPAIKYFRRRPEVLSLEITPPPLLYREFGGDMDALVEQMERLTAEGVRAIADRRTRPALGPRKVRRIHPWSEPRTLRETGGQPVPTFRATGRQRQIEGAIETRAFRTEYRECREKRRGGALDTVYPLGTYRMRVEHQAPVAERSIGDLVTKPGPTLADVRKELARDAAARIALCEAACETIGAVRSTLDQQMAAAVSEHELDHEASSVRRVPANGGESAEDVVTRHRFARDPDAGTQVRRIVVLRDHRRGRPPGGRSGNDPPA